MKDEGVFVWLARESMNWCDHPPDAWGVRFTWPVRVDPSLNFLALSGATLSMRTLHLGELLVKNNAMTTQQRDEVLLAQRQRGGPFGALAEEMFGVSPQAVEAAWAEQYSTFAPHIDPCKAHVNPRALEVINRRQAWQFCFLPIELHGEDLTVCTSQEHLVRALKFAGWRLAQSCQFVLCDAQSLGQALCKYYPMAGMTADTVRTGFQLTAVR